MRETRSYGAGEQLRNVLVGVVEAAVALMEEDDQAVRRGHEQLHAVLAELGEPNIFTAHGAAIGHAAAAALALRPGQDDDAEAHVRTGYEQALLTNDRPILAAVGLSVAAWTRARGRSRDAAVVLGATTRLRGTEDPTSPVVQALTTALRADLGPDFDACYAEGLALDAAEATRRIDPDAVVPAPAGPTR
jgi:hypothetical protein